MDIMEIILLVAGGIIFVLSFFIPDKKTQASGSVSEEDVQSLISRELGAVRGHVDDVLEEAVAHSMEKTERSLERLSNEKIMAVSEYSDTVLGEIHKSHEEIMFLYDMLNNKHISLKNTVAELNRTVKEAEEAIKELRKLVSEPEASAAKAGEIIPEYAEPEVLPGSEESVEALRREPDEEERKDDSREPERQGSNNNNESILRLYRRGKSVMDIARELDLGVGEVKLVIDLFRNQQN